MELNTKIYNLRAQFPLLSSQPEYIYLDNAATTHKPESVLNAMNNFYTLHYANTHRGVYDLSVKATAKFEHARARTAKFLNCKTNEIVFTKNATEAINLVAYSLGNTRIQEGDEVLISALEHHANFLPWKRLCAQKKARLVIAPARPDGTLDEEKTLSLITPSTRIIAITSLSNVTGASTPLAKIIERAKENKTYILIDGAQAVAHGQCDMRSLDADFFVFSGHKLFGPTGIGILYARAEHLQNMEPFLLGGEMVKNISNDAVEWNDIPWKFEAGTQPIAETIGLCAALDFVESIGWPAIQTIENSLTEYALNKFNELRGVSIIGPTTKQNRAPIISFKIDGIHPHDMASIANDQHIALRAGHFCAQPFLDALGHKALIRASFTLYNTLADVDALIESITTAQKIFHI